MSEHFCTMRTLMMTGWGLSCLLFVDDLALISQKIVYIFPEIWVTTWSSEATALQ